MEECKFYGVFLEWAVPELDGKQLARQIRSSKSNSFCPMVVLTASKD
jgi:PleD family two-component response regulator